VGKRLRRLLRGGLDDNLLLRVEELGALGHQLTYRLERLAVAPTFKFSALAGKAFYAASSFIRWGFGSLALLAAATSVRLALDARDGTAFAPFTRLRETAASPLLLAAVALLLLFTTRRVLQRLEDREV
jgi:hypothetical protein